MLGVLPQPVPRGPSAHAQFSALLVCDKPMVGLPFFSGANIARNSLPDHRISLTT
jgi:hypothetical protein